jgi:hypothetical protein
MTMVVDKTVFLTLTAETCCTCGLVFGLEAGHQRQLRESHEFFYCPNGHRQHYTAQTDKERRIAELERTEKALRSSEAFWKDRTTSARAEAERKTRQVNCYKGVVTRFKRRLVAGRCPCCSHAFKDLERHMKNQHPKYDPDRAADALAGKEA